MDFRWNRWNEGHIARHGVAPEEAEEALLHARKPFPRKYEDKWLAWGATVSGRMLQVVFVLDLDATVFIIHARDLTDRERKRLRRSTS